MVHVPLRIFVVASDACSTAAQAARRTRWTSGKLCIPKVFRSAVKSAGHQVRNAGANVGRILMRLNHSATPGLWRVQCPSMPSMSSRLRYGAMPMSASEKHSPCKPSIRRQCFLHLLKVAIVEAKGPRDVRRFEALRDDLFLSVMPLRGDRLRGRAIEKPLDAFRTKSMHDVAVAAGERYFGAGRMHVLIDGLGPQPHSRASWRVGGAQAAGREKPHRDIRR